MVRIICLIFVFGIASLCVASFIHATPAYARTDRHSCPCWRFGPTQLAEILGGDPKTTTVEYPSDQCDTNHRAEHDFSQAQLLIQSAEAQSSLDEPYANAFIVWNIRSETHGVELTSCDNHSLTGPMDGITVSEAQACMQDILAYCRDYCKYNPTAQCQKRP